MALPTAGFRVFCRVAGAAGLAGALVTVAACTPAIEAWRDASGIAKNDPDPQNAPFTQNLADAESAPYPNLASVPPPPTRATTAAERQKLAQSLVADRAATEAAAGPHAARPAAAAAAAATPAAAGHVAASPAAAAPAAATGAAAPPAAAAAPTKVASNPAPADQTGRRAAGEPPVPSPRDSTLEMPDVRSLPEPEAARAAPPPPGLAALPRPAPAAAPSPAALATATPEPAPPVPDLTPAPPPPALAKPVARHGPEVTTVATVDKPEGSAEIARVAALYKEKPATVRLVGYAAANPGGDPLAGYQAALDRAQAVGKALAAAGIPANKIQSEAAPAAGGRPAGRVEVQFVQ